jgi:hypothetical protein
VCAEEGKGMCEGQGKGGAATPHDALGCCCLPASTAGLMAGSPHNTEC